MQSIFFSQQLLDAIDLMVSVHASMKRKGDGKPYIVHPIAVFGILELWGADEETCIAGLLHDVLEDVPEEEKSDYRKKIGDQFGTVVLDIVEGVTEQDKTLPWKKRKEAYLKHLEHASKQALLVSAADKTHNSRTLAIALEEEGKDVWKRFNAPQDDKMWFLKEVRKALDKGLDPKYVHELHENIQSIQMMTGDSTQAFADNLNRNVSNDVETN